MPIPGFRHETAKINSIDISWSEGGEGPALLLLHGFPQTRALWHFIGPELAKHHRVICPDLRGYGASGKPSSVEDYTFRKMAQDQLALMDRLGFSNFFVAGHDRGARVAHRLALDAPQAVNRLCLMDIVPTHTLLDPLQTDVAKDYYHWFFLAQPEPFPETLIGYDPDTYYTSCLLGWGGAELAHFDPVQLDAYRAAWNDKDTVRGMCNDYRAALSHDFRDDSADLDQRVTCPTLVLYGADGAMAKHYDVKSTWQDKCENMACQAVPGGHFFLDTNPQGTVSALGPFFQA